MNYLFFYTKTPSKFSPISDKKINLVYLSQIKTNNE